MSESHWWYLSHKEGRAETLQHGLEFDNLKPLLKSCIFKSISWLNGSFFGGDDRGFLKEGVKTYLMTPISPLNPPTFLLSSHLLSMSARRGGMTEMRQKCHTYSVQIQLFIQNSLYVVCVNASGVFVLTFPGSLRVAQGVRLDHSWDQEEYREVLPARMSSVYEQSPSNKTCWTSFNPTTPRPYE
jgi:hypothetical protein